MAVLPLDGVAAAAKQGLHAVLLRSVTTNADTWLKFDFGELPEFGIRQLFLLGLKKRR